MPKPTIFMGQEFLSQGDAADAFGIASSTMSRYALAGKLGELENRIRVKRQLQLPNLSAPSPAPENRLVSFSAEYLQRFRGVASVPAHVPIEEFVEWFKNHGDVNGMSCTGEEWSWGTFNECLVIDPSAASDDAFIFTEETFPKPKAIPDEPVGTIRSISVQTITLVMHQKWPVPNVDLKMEVFEDAEANRWVLIDETYRLVDQDNRVTYQNWEKDRDAGKAA